MKKLVSESLAAYGILLILSAIIVFHCLIITGIIPFEIVWGGRLKNHSQMLQFESISIALNLIMLAIVAVRIGILKVNLKPAILKIAFWLMALLFSLNTIGNLLSSNSLETMIFTPLTLLLAVFCFRLAVSKASQSGLQIDQDDAN